MFGYALLLLLLMGSTVLEGKYHHLGPVQHRIIMVLNPVLFVVASIVWCMTTIAK